MAHKNEFIVQYLTHSVWIKPVSINFTSLKNAICDRFPELKDHDLNLFYYKFWLRNEQVLINTEDDFKCFLPEWIKWGSLVLFVRDWRILDARSALKEMLRSRNPLNSVIPSSHSSMETSYKICIVNNENDSEDKFVLIKPSPLNFDSFKETIFDRFPMFQNQPIYIFYKDTVGDKMIIGTASDFQFFLEQGVKKIFIVKNPQQNIWLNDKLSSKSVSSEEASEIEKLNKALEASKIKIDALNETEKRHNSQFAALCAKLDSDVFGVQNQNEALTKALNAAKMEIIALKQEASNIDEIKKDLENAKNDLELLKKDLEKAKNDTQNTSLIEENVFVASTSQTAHVPSTENPEIIQKINCNETGKDISKLEGPSTKNNDNDESGIPAEDVNGTSTDEWTFIETNENAEGRSDNSSSTVADPEEMTPSENTGKLDKNYFNIQNASSVQTQTENAAKIDTITQLPKPNDVFEMDLNRQLYNLFSSEPGKKASVSNVSQSLLIETVDETTEDSASADNIAGNSEESIPLIQLLDIAAKFKEALISKSQSDAQK